MDALLIVYVAANNLAWSRLGISVSKRVGKAVQRNYVRRRIREAFRSMKADLPTGLDIVCIARPESAHSADDLAASLRSLVLRAAAKWAKREAGSKSQPDRPPAQKRPDQTGPCRSR